ncbi:siroheme synthase [Neobacillus sp. MM2021_6]|uniref:precorrin-2 dehydrogenase/sirohydrochlorin ferrochelatase family protein n=1 Tax=Bacillaceae TaxID=186817 RepID=UPI00140CF70E|nr:MULTISPECIES: NAD(P)-dependent oxidoreductase [Bacillaceae]MBO0959288.1 siroheme synthase [Neobacillus sp. MM2021_6]NHC20605.1 siroheme synthase [Bacillus sp. MM2020_4]
MSSNYPIMIQLEGKKVVVVGGGKVAERKVSGLLVSGARIVMISPKATEKLQELFEAGKIEWLQRPFCDVDLKGAFMVFAATNDSRVNQLIKESVEPHQLVMIVDDPDGSDFHLPAVVYRGRLSIAVSTGGASPTLSKKIRAQLEREFDDKYAEYLEFLFMKRKWIIGEVADPALKRSLLTAIVSDDFLHSLDREGDFQRLYEGLIY